MLSQWPPRHEYDPCHVVEDILCGAYLGAGCPPAARFGFPFSRVVLQAWLAQAHWRSDRCVGDGTRGFPAEVGAVVLISE